MSALILTTACSNDDDATGASTMKATTPSLSVALDFDSSISIVEQEATYGFTVSISEPQIVDIRVNLTQIGGDATNGEDFSMPPNVTIVAGKTSVSDVIAIHADDIPEAVETAVIQIANGNEANVVSISKATATFTILNLVSGDLAASMSWAANGTVTDNGGNEIDPYDLADLTLLLTDVPYTTILDGAGGAGAIRVGTACDHQGEGSQSACNRFARGRLSRKLHHHLNSSFRIAYLRWAHIARNRLNRT